MIDELERIIKKAAIDGTLNESAAKQMQDTIEENRTLKAKLEIMESEATALRDRKSEQERELKKLNGEANAVADREETVAKREEKMTELELRAEHQSERVRDHQSMFERVFRNTEIRRNVFTPVPGLPASDLPYQPYSTPYAQENEQTERSE